MVYDGAFLYCGNACLTLLLPLYKVSFFFFLHYPLSTSHISTPLAKSHFSLPSHPLFSSPSPLFLPFASQVTTTKMNSSDIEFSAEEDERPRLGRRGVVPTHPTGNRGLHTIQRHRKMSATHLPRLMCGAIGLNSLYVSPRRHSILAAA